ncbi:DegT/DnrJ/EryC1/StrS family aminotransferase [Pseudorhodoferax sp. Leaf267]|uniref:DegT/DnrJ/EryC1/StrS family aminotransferase n=1 Tax=Pseudorhodoferax sp. Leaf267 TaxID=1736316 RepID=UPI001F321B94|nr:DegT/DnrJ/EryC1/StrS family aminotransferase [Pseudorhodoferax sp. Leaf267]
MPARTLVRVLRPQLPTIGTLKPYIERIDGARIYSNYGPLSREFGERLGRMAGAAGTALTANGTSAIELALRLRARQGSLCLMPAFTFIASAHAVCNAGLTPYLADVDAEALVLTTQIAHAALAQAPAQVAAVLVVSAFGAPPDQGAWAQFEADTGIPVVFDAAAAVTALDGIGRQPVCVSLHATKVLGIGEGGAIFSADTALTDEATALTGFGFRSAERVSTLRGGNYRISEYAAAVGLAAMDGLPQQTAALRALTAAYASRLQHKAARLQRGAGAQWVTMTLNAIVPASQVQAVTDRMDADRIEWRRWWGLGCHRHPAFADVPRATLRQTDAVAPCVIGLPFHLGLTQDEIDRVVACLP